MKRISTVFALASVGAVMVAPGAHAGTAQVQVPPDYSKAKISSQARAFAAKQCAAERKASARTFKARYGAIHSRAMAACIRTAKGDVRNEVVAAITACSNEIVADPDAFAATYGDGKASGLVAAIRAFPACVKSKVGDDVKQRIQQFRAAVRTCVAELRADRAAFRATYGRRGAPAQAVKRCVQSKLTPSA